MYEDSKGDRFWHAFGLEDTGFANGLKILEFGCGEGERCLELFNAGATNVVGLDTSEVSIDKARRNLENHCPQTPKAIRYRACDLRELAEGDFDVVVSENTFEHLSDLDDILQELVARMKPDAIMYIGFAPLYFSPQGDHGWMRQCLPFFPKLAWPWGHLVLPESFYFRRMSKFHGRDIKGFEDWPYLYLNRLKLEDYLKAFADAGLVVKSLNVNPAYSFKAKAVSALAKIPFVRDYCIWGVYAVLEKPGSD